MKILMIMLLAATAMACSEDEYKIQAVCKITGVRNLATGESAAWSDSCVLETLTPKDGYNNLYRILIHLSGGSPIAMLTATPDYVKAQNTLVGNVVITAMLWGAITISPSCPAVRASIASRAPVFEIRPQVLSVSMLSPKVLEIRLEEKWGDFYGGLASADWLSRYAEAFPRMSHAK